MLVSFEIKQMQISLLSTVAHIHFYIGRRFRSQMSRSNLPAQSFHRTNISNKEIIAHEALVDVNADLDWAVVYWPQSQ